MLDLRSTHSMAPCAQPPGRMREQTRFAYHVSVTYISEKLYFELWVIKDTKGRLIDKSIASRPNDTSQLTRYIICQTRERVLIFSSGHNSSHFSYCFVETRQDKRCEWDWSLVSDHYGCNASLLAKVGSSLHETFVLLYWKNDYWDNFSVSGMSLEVI